jgi:signal transduction histidine kinase
LFNKKNLKSSKISLINRPRIKLDRRAAQRHKFSLLAILAFLFATLWVSPLFAQDRNLGPFDVIIGVLAKRGDEHTIRRWQPTAEYLTDKLTDYHFSIKPLDFEEIYPAVENGDVDFILTNSAIYVELEHRYGIGRIVTLRNLGLDNIPHDRFGGVVFSRADRNDLSELKDLPGSRFAAVKENSFGGYIMALREFRELDIYPQKEFISVDFLGTHDAVVHAVAEGRYDAGTVRTDTLERMAREGLIELNDFRVLSAIEYENFTLGVSTRLYPEWPLAKVRYTSDEIANQVASVLLGMPKSVPAAVAGNYDGWSVPGNYQSVHEVMQELRIGPYEKMGDIRISDLMHQYGYWILAIFVLGFLLITSNFYIFRLNLRLRQNQNALQKSKSDLEHKFNELKLLQAELVAREKMASLGRMVAGFAHEVNTPIGVAVGATSHAQEAANNLQQLLDQEEIQEEDLRDQLEMVTETSELALINLRRASDLVQSFKRTSIDQSSEHPRNYSLSELIHDVINSLQNQFKRTQMEFVVICDESLKVLGIPGIHSQLLTNLIMNSHQHGFANGTKAGEIRIEADLIDGDQLLIDYRDNGDGITPEALTRIYEPFFTTNRSQGGSGLGMYICYNLVTNQLGGSIECECPSGGGVHFRIVHPVQSI